jgi:hypothetical protein
MTTRLGLGFAFVLGLAGCESDPIQPGPPDEPFAVTPASATVAAGATAQFAARTVATGAPVSVRWEVGNAAHGTISQTGLFTASACAVGAGSVRAVLLADDSRSATAQLSLTNILPARVAIGSISDAATRASSDINALSAPVETVVQVAGSTCYQVTSVQLRLSSAAGVVTLGTVDFPAAPTTSVVRTLLWNPGAFANGTYSLTAVITVAGSNPEASPVLSVKIQHP